MRHALTVACAFVRKDLIEAASYRLQFLMRFVVVAAQLVFLYLLSDFVGDLVEEKVDNAQRFFDFIVVGLCAMAFLNTALGELNQRIRRAQTLGTLEALLATRTPLAVILACLPLYALLQAALTSTIYLGLGWAFFELPLRPSGFVAGAVVLALMIAAFGCLGMITAGLTVAFKRADIVERSLSFASFFMGGVWFPVSEWPVPVQKLAQLLPITPGLEGLRAALLGGASVGDVGSTIVRLAVFIAVMLPIGAWVFHATLRRSLRDGTLTDY